MSIHSNEVRLRGLFDEHSGRLYAYAVRHTDPDIAQDVVSEVFLLAWRRIDEVPDHALPWLLVSARNIIRNHHRSVLRRARLTRTAAQFAPLPVATPSAEAEAVERTAVLEALEQLSALEREALLLTSWDGLTARDAALVAGCSTRAFEVRLSRARARLSRLLDAPEPSPSPRATVREELA
ncbi:RNA polymerase sigma factor [Nocardioides sp.]|uniref:RNA polymerase sigma factor n=1 Tax=Nocardioides sp. TaxID=35761 RepID=UPI00263710B3|nr:RNA polymerase sigma factor [Nocardioides sp.]